MKKIVATYDYQVDYANGDTMLINNKEVRYYESDDLSLILEDLGYDRNKYTYTYDYVCDEIDNSNIGQYILYVLEK